MLFTFFIGRLKCINKFRLRWSTKLFEAVAKANVADFMSIIFIVPEIRYSDGIMSRRSLLCSFLWCLAIFFESWAVRVVEVIWSLSWSLGIHDVKLWNRIHNLGVCLLLYIIISKEESAHFDLVRHDSHLWEIQYWLCRFSLGRLALLDSDAGIHLL